MFGREEPSILSLEAPFEEEKIGKVLLNVNEFTEDPASVATMVSKPLFSICEFSPDITVELTRETRRYMIPRIL